MATAKKDDTAEAIAAMDAEKDPADWPTAPLAPSVPTFDGQPGDRIKIRTNVSIFGLPALEDAVVFDTPEVRAAAETGLLVILEDAAK